MWYGLSMPFHLLWLSQEQACHAWPFFGQKRARFGTIFCHFLELPRRKRTPTHVFPCMWRSYGPSKRFHLVWLSQEQACHAWLFLVKNGPGLGHFLPFLGVAKELKDPNTCFPVYMEVIWPIWFGWVRSKPAMLGFFWSTTGQVWAIFYHFWELPMS